jgi:hypothetical protein
VKRLRSIDWRSRLAVLKRLRPSDDQRVDVAFLAGLASIAAGCGWIFPPAAPIVGGVFLAGVAWTAGRSTTEARPGLSRGVETWYSVDEDGPEG